jgi:predicted enzyme related to lactoylglutathione lyase
MAPAEAESKVFRAGGISYVRIPARNPGGDLWVATFRDPAGNILGVWQRGPRE